MGDSGNLVYKIKNSSNPTERNLQGTELGSNRGKIATKKDNMKKHRKERLVSASHERAQTKKKKLSNCHSATANEERISEKLWEGGMGRQTKGRDGSLRESKE